MLTLVKLLRSLISISCYTFAFILYMPGFLKTVSISTQRACHLCRKYTGFSINLSQVVYHFTAYSPTLLVCGWFATVPTPAQQGPRGLPCKENGQFYSQKCLTLLPISLAWVKALGVGLEPAPLNLCHNPPWRKPPGFWSAALAWLPATVPQSREKVLHHFDTFIKNLDIHC